jgi:nucleotide sugar dehydrogenase
LNIAVIGMGKIGLPLAVQFASKGHNVSGGDINQQTVDSINSGITPFPGEKDLEVLLPTLVKSGLLRASVDIPTIVSKSTVVVVVVPLFINSDTEPDFGSIDLATLSIASGLQQGTLVSYETTLPIGTTRNRFTPTLEKHTNMRVGKDFHVVFSPERVLTGRVLEDLRKYPKILGGVTQECAFVGEKFYSSVLDFDERIDLQKKNGVWLMESTESAEFVKLAETTYRDVNIALANQFAKLADQKALNIYDVIEAANSQSYSHIHKPGISVGGHCIPVYPHLYLQSDPNANLVSSARTINSGMPHYAISTLAQHFGNLADKKVLVLGISYRSGVKEVAFSGVFDLVKELEYLGGIVGVYDPLFTENEIKNLGLNPFDGNKHDVDFIVLQTDDLAFKEFITKEFFMV